MIIKNKKLKRKNLLQKIKRMVMIKKMNIKNRRPKRREINGGKNAKKRKRHADKKNGRRKQSPGGSPLPVTLAK